MDSASVAAINLEAGMEQDLDSRVEHGGIGRKLEMGLVLTGGFLNTVVALIFGELQAASPGSPWQNLYPFPLLYLIEIVALGYLALLPLLHEEPGRERPGRMPALIWISAGGLLAFVILGGFSIGFYLIPGMLAFVIAGILADRRQNLSLTGHVGLMFLAASIQAAIMLIVVNWF
jgi:hypothetical protein